ncbi:ATP-binding protein [Bacillus sp. FJAT-27251]|uniref:ATP-binding protein n=1 Tax=Bacillus sp. FJAT-27251 TaxID=1684142 RepID=UPI0006A7BFA3|nr:ATP-binding protein [Bacillus sp. FJAT-27251]
MQENEPYYITESKIKCKLRGMKPDDIPRPQKVIADNELFQKRKEYSEILSVVSYFSKKVLDSLLGTPILIIVSDSHGYLLDIAGNDIIKSTIEKFGIQIGSHFTEEDAGTNVINLTLQQKHPISLIGKNHYHECLHNIACYGAAFHYTDEEQLLGTISIMTPISFQNPMLLTMLAQVVESIERELLLRRQNRKLNMLNQILLSASQKGIVITDEKGTILEFNEFAREIFNRKKGSFIGRSIYNMGLPGEYCKQVLEQELKFENEEVHYINKNGDKIIFLLDAQPIYEGDKVVGAFGQFRDITERYIMEEKIKEAEKEALAGRIAAGIAHEIRNPLTTVRGYLQFLKTDMEDSTARLFSNVLIPEIDRANKIISDFLSIAKPSVRAVEPIRMKDFLLGYLFKFLNSEALLHNVEMDIVIDPETSDMSIICNREELLQVFINLLQNSLQAKGTSPLRIEVSAKLVDSRVHFVFQDNGKGIPDPVLSHIFEPFFTTRDEGTGLGLSVSRKIVENHNGRIQAASSENGTTFVLDFPVIPQSEDCLLKEEKTLV